MTIMTTIHALRRQGPYARRSAGEYRSVSGSTVWLLIALALGAPLALHLIARVMS